MKKLTRILSGLLIVLLVNTVTASADRGGHFSRGGHGGFHGGGRAGVGIVVGPGWWGPGWWGPYPYYGNYPYYPYSPQTIVVDKSPEIYVQPAPKTDEAVFWYYCPDPQGYYPDVRKCPKGWLKVVPPAKPAEGEE
jgi:hypothetical protein